MGSGWEVGGWSKVILVLRFSFKLNKNCWSKNFYVFTLSHVSENSAKIINLILNPSLTLLSTAFQDQSGRNEKTNFVTTKLVVTAVTTKLVVSAYLHLASSPHQQETLYIVPWGSHHQIKIGNFRLFF